MTYRWFGAEASSSGRVVVYAHGGLSCAADGAFAHDAARARGIRVLAVNRPGIDGSTRQRDRRVSEWADDVAGVLDTVGVSSAAAAGWSLGGPYALALGARLGSRVSRVAVFAGVPPLHGDGVLRDLNVTDRLLLLQSRRMPTLARVTVRALRRHQASARRGRLDQRLWGPADMAVLRGPGGGVLASAVTNGLADVDAVLDEYRAWWAPWGFGLADVAVPVRVWQGDADAWVPVAMADRLARGVPHGQVSRCPGDGHLLVAHRWPEALDWLMSPAAEPPVGPPPD